MENDVARKNKLIQTLQSRVSELERQLAEAQAAAREGVSAREKAAPADRLDAHQSPAADPEPFPMMEDRFGQALLAAPYPMMIRREDGQVIMLNTAWTEITGYTLKDIPTLKAWTRKAYGKQAAKRQSFIMKEGFSQEGVKKWGEFEIITRSGAKRIWDFSTAPLGVDSEGRQLVMAMAADVTERRNAEQALAESERQQRELAALLELDRARLAAILEQLPVGIWIADESGRLVHKNRQADQIWAGEAPLVESIADYHEYESWLPESDIPLKPEEYPVARALQTGETIEPVELKIRRFDGSEGAVLVSAAPIRNSQGQLTGAIGVNMDITERKQAEKALQSSRNRIHDILTSLGDGLFALDRSWSVIYINDQAAQIAGLPLEMMVGKNFWELWPTLLGTPIEQAYRQAMDSGRPGQLRIQGRQSGRWYDVNVYPSSEGIAVFYVDKTEQVLADQALRESEARFSTAFNKLPFGMTISRREDGKIMDVNAAWLELFGWTKEEVLGKTSADLGFYVKPEQREAVRNRAMNEEHLHNLELHVRRKNGSELIILFASTIIDIHGERCILAVANDITERKRAEERLQAARDEAAWLARLPGENPAPVVRASAQGMVLYSNPQAASLPGWACAVNDPLPFPLLSLVQEAMAHGQVVKRDVLLGNRFYLVYATPILAEGYANLYGSDITERLQAEEALVRNERQQRELARQLELDRARLTATLKHLPVGVWIANQEGRVIGKNEQADRIWGGDAPLPQNVEEYQKYIIRHPLTGERLSPEQMPMTRALRTGEVIEPIEINIERFDGSEGTILVSAAPIRDSQQRLTGAVAVNVDITERKRMEKERQQAEERYTKLFNAVREGFAQYQAIYDERGNIVDLRVIDINPAGAAMSGVSREVQLGKAWRELWPGVDENILRMYQRADQTDEMIRFDDQNKITGRTYDVAITKIANGEFIATFNDITDRRQTEQALRASEAKMRAVFQSLVEGVVFLHPNGEVEEVNDAIQSMYAHTLEELSDPTLDPRTRIIRPDGTPFPVEEQPAIVALRSGQIVRDVEIGVPTSEGQISWRLVNAQPVYDDQGVLLGAVASFFDITDRKNAERARQESEERFEKAFRSSPDAMVISRLSDGLLIDVNEGWERVFGYRREEVLVRTVFELGIYVDPNDRKTMLSRLQEHGSVRDFEVNIRRKSGEVRQINMAIEKIEILATECLLVVFRDVTEQKLAEQALKESEERFHSLADSMPQLVWTALPDGTVDYYNQRHKEYQEIRELPGSSWEWSPVLHPEDTQATVDAWQHSVMTGEIYQIEHRVRMADGSYRWHLSRGIPVFDEHGHITRWFGTATDVHEQKLAAEKLKSYAEKLEQSNQELEQFAFMASHDLQEPLRKIQMFGDLLFERATHLEDREREYIRRMRSAAGRMRDMVNGLLQLSRLNTQSKPFTHVDLSQVTAGAMSDLTEQVRRQDGHVEIGDLPVITGDPLQLRQLMQNLIGNALKYHKPGIPPQVRVYAAQTADEVEIHVQDNGIGFDPEYVDRIFQPFQRLVGHSQYEGSGMGLAICRRIVERHGGKITAHSQVGEGTTFVITLPLEQPIDSEQEGYES